MRSPFFWPAVLSVAVHGAILFPGWGWRPPRIELPRGTRSVTLHLMASPYLRAAPRRVVRERPDPTTPDERAVSPPRETTPPPLQSRRRIPAAIEALAEARPLLVARPPSKQAPRVEPEAEPTPSKTSLDASESVPPPKVEELVPPPAEKPPAAETPPEVASKTGGEGRQSANSDAVNSDVGERGVQTGKARVLGCIPEYPRLSRVRGEEGTVVLEVEVRPDGTPAAIRVVRSSGYRRLDRAAVEGMRKARFSPATRGGRPTGDTIRVAITFDLRDADQD